MFLSRTCTCVILYPNFQNNFQTSSPCLYAYTFLALRNLWVQMPEIERVYELKKKQKKKQDMFVKHNDLGGSYRVKDMEQ